jgi:hypothetical protein
MHSKVKRMEKEKGKEMWRKRERKALRKPGITNFFKVIERKRKKKKKKKKLWLATFSMVKALNTSSLNSAKKQDTCSPHN